MGACLVGELGRDLREAHDGETVADLPQVRRGAVQLDDPGPGAAVNQVSLEPLAVVDVADQDALVGKKAGEPREILRDGEAAPRSGGWRP